MGQPLYWPDSEFMQDPNHYDRVEDRMAPTDAEQVAPRETELA